MIYDISYNIIIEMGNCNFKTEKDNSELGKFNYINISLAVTKNHF